MTTVSQDENIRIVRMALGPYETNTYILICQKSGESVIVDAPGEAGKVLAQLEGTTPAMILMTHNHMDHVGALSELKQTLKVPVAAHPADAGRLPAVDLSFWSGVATIDGLTRGLADLQRDVSAVSPSSSDGGSGSSGSSGGFFSGGGSGGSSGFSSGSFGGGSGGGGTSMSSW